jgi:hypothetical protein
MSEEPVDPLTPALSPAAGEKQDAEEPLGLRCARCGCRHFWVTHTEPATGGRIRRRRQCRHCRRRIVTYEQGPGADLRGRQP